MEGITVQANNPCAIDTLPCANFIRCNNFYLTNGIKKARPVINGGSLNRLKESGKDFIAVATVLPMQMVVVAIALVLILAHQAQRHCFGCSMCSNCLQGQNLSRLKR